MKRFATPLLAWILIALLLLSAASAEALDAAPEAPETAQEAFILTEADDGAAGESDMPEETGGTVLADLEGAGDAGDDPDAPLSDPDDAGPSDEPAAVSNSALKAKAGKKLDDASFIRAATAMLREYRGNADVYANSAGDYATARLIVRAKGDLPDLSAWNAADVVRDKGNLYFIQFYTPDEARQCAEALSALPGVKGVWPDRIIRLQSAGSGSGDAQANRDVDHMSWGVSVVHADDYAEDLARRKKTPKVVVAVLDTGVYTGSLMFDGRLVEGYDFINGTSRMTDEDGHGTNVAGIICDCTWGLNVKVMPLRILDGDGMGSDTLVVLAIRYAMIHGAKVLNMSLGNYTGTEGPYPEDEEYLNAIKKGVVVVIAAGNNGKNTKYCSPAHLKKAIVVAALDRENKTTSWSNYGSTVDVAAPGVEIRSGSHQGRMYISTLSGTSQSTPHVAAAAAMLLCDNPRLTPAQAQKKLREAATDLGPKGWDKHYGAGLLNLEPFVQTYGVDYDLHGGRGNIAPQIKQKGRKLTLRKVKPTKSCDVYFVVGGVGTIEIRPVKAKFSGWNTSIDGTGKAYKAGGSYKANASATLFAQWKFGKLGKLPVPTLEGYTFDGWYTAPEGGEKVTSKTVIKETMNLYAHWTPVAEAE